MKDWGDVRDCVACGSRVLWDLDDGRWVHEVAGADHEAVPPAGRVVVTALDASDLRDWLTLSGVRVDVVVRDLVDAAAAATAPARPCPGRCNDRWRSSLRRAVEEVRDATVERRVVDERLLQLTSQPRPGDPVWCADDAAHVLKALGRLPDLAALVNVREDGRLNAGRSDADGRSSSGAAPGSPSPAHDVLDAVVRWAVDEAEQMSSARVSGPDERAAAPLDAGWLTEAVATLTRRADDWLGDGEHGEQAGRDTLRWERDLERATGQDLLVHRLPGVRCPACSTRALTRTDGLDQVDCARCGWSKPHQEYVALVADAAQRHRQEERERRRAARAQRASA